MRANLPTIVAIALLLISPISASQLTNSVEALVLGRTPASISEGWSVQWMGWGLGIFVLALTCPILFRASSKLSCYSAKHEPDRKPGPQEMEVACLTHAINTSINNTRHPNRAPVQSAVNTALAPAGGRCNKPGKFWKRGIFIKPCSKSPRSIPLG